MMKLIFAVFAVCLLCLALGSESLVFSQLSPPAPLFSELLTTVRLERNGIFKPRRIYTSLIPNDKGSLKVLHNDIEIAEYTFRSPRYPGNTSEIWGYSLVRGKNDPLGLRLNKAGRYELAYYTGGKKFYSFPFELIVTGNTGPQGRWPLILMNGAWNDYAFLARTSKASHGRWQFRVWVRNDDGKYVQSKGFVSLTHDETKRLVAIGTANFRREGLWTKETLTLEEPGKKNAKGEYQGNKVISAANFKFEDGSFTFRFVMDGKLYGVYKFSVRNGTIQPQGRQVRENTPPHLFIDGGENHFWLKKQ
jgi:hypothetical protein